MKNIVEISKAQISDATYTVYTNQENSNFSTEF